MKRLNTRQLYKRFHKEIDNLPILVMKNQKPYAYIIPVEDVEIEENYEAKETAASSFDVLMYKGTPVVQKESVAHVEKTLHPRLQQIKDFLTKKL